MPIDSLPASPAGEISHLTVRNKINEVIARGNEAEFTDYIFVRSASDFTPPLSSTALYFVVVSEIDLTGAGFSIEVPLGGLNIQGLGNNLTTITCSDASFTMFASPVGNSGNLFLRDIQLTVSGGSSRIYGLTDADGSHAVECSAVNYTNCASLGEISGYRQILGTNIGRFGGTPELILSGNIQGFRETVSIVRGSSNYTALFRAGTALSIGSRFVCNINADLPASGALCDFSPSNIQNDESLIFENSFVTRLGSIDTDDPNITPNISNENVQSKWSDNTGLPNTVKYLESRITTEIETVISDPDTYYPLAGTWTVTSNVHFDMPANGEFRLLSGNGAYFIGGSLTIDGTQNQVLDLRVVRSSDDGATWPDVINHLRRPINNLLGFRDVAFFELSFIVTLSENDRIRLEIENIGNTGNLTAELDSYIIPREI